MKKSIYVYFFLFFIPSLMFAQEQLGLRLGNYAGVYGLGINPTATFNNPLRWDINLVGTAAFFDNSYAYIRNSNVKTILTNLENAEVAPFVEDFNALPINAPILDFYVDGRKKFLNSKNTFHLPSIAFKINAQHSVGVFLNIRAEGGSNDIPPSLNFYSIYKKPFTTIFQLPPARAVGMVWGEVGVNYAFQQEIGNDHFSIGVNVKYLQGYEAGYAVNKKLFSVSQYPGDTIFFSQPNVHYGFASSNDTGKDLHPEQNGTGYGIDLGINYTIGDDDEGYVARLGASVLDMGYVRFTKNAEQHQILINKDFKLWSAEYKNFKSVHETLNLLSYQVLNDSTKSTTGNSFALGLPTGFSLQADVKLIKNCYVNAFLMQRIPSKLGIQRTNILAITPRFEHRWFEASLPIVVYNWQRARVGAAVRLAFLTLGTDYLGSFSSNNNVTGSDFYVALKINPFNLGLDLSGLSLGRSKKKGRYSSRKVKCYKF
jgi:Family of unknown function (DUF5723)